METKNILSLLKEFGVGRRKLDDVLFVKDQPPPRLGIYDDDDDDNPDPCEHV